MADEIDDLLRAMEGLPVEDVEMQEMYVDDVQLGRSVHGDNNSIIVEDRIIQLNQDGDIIGSSSLPAAQPSSPPPPPPSPPPLQSVAVKVTPDPSLEIPCITLQSATIIAKEVYGEQADVTVTDNTGGILIHFPELELTNTDRARHTIYDLYVRIDLTMNVPGVIYNVNLLGVRATLTPEEIKAQYAHSHLPGEASKGVFRAFCLGNSHFATLKINLIACPTEDNWMLFLLALPNYLKWESLEGGPHRKMRDVPKSISNSINFDDELRIIVPYLPAEVFDLSDRLEINTYHSALLQTYDAHSRIKSVEGSSARNVDRAREEWLSAHRLPFDFHNDKPVKFKVISSKPVQESTTVDITIANRYNLDLTNYIINFNNQFENEYTKSKFDSRLGAIPAFQQADLDHYRQATRANRPLTRKGRSSGVVGRVDYIRKREDHRLG